jgi:hypothetical protein
MTDLSDRDVTMDDVTREADRRKFHWTLTGTNAGPAGTGKRVRISGYEPWKIDSDGLIAESKGHFDSAELRNTSSNIAIAAISPANHTKGNQTDPQEQEPSL